MNSIVYMPETPRVVTRGGWPASGTSRAFLFGVLEAEEAGPPGEKRRHAHEEETGKRNHGGVG